MAQKDRLESIEKIINQEKKVVVTELSRQFGVTDETIRRDLEKLEDKGIVTRTYGGAVLNAVNIAEKIHFTRRAQTNVEEKRTIARLATRFIEENMKISADSSSTVVETLRLLKSRKDLTVLTNSLIILDDLDNTDMEIISTGGIINKNSLSFEGVITKTTLENFHVDTLLISCKGLHMNGGIFDSNESEAELKRILVEHAQKVILLVDHTKFNKFAFVKFMDLNEIDILVTDREPNAEWKRLLQQMNIKLVYE